MPRHTSSSERDGTAYDAPISIATGPTIRPFDQWTPSRGDKPGGFSSKECIAGAAFADLIIGTLFGFQPNWQGGMLTDPKRAMPWTGTLRNLRYRGRLYNVSATARGLSIKAASR